MANDQTFHFKEDFFEEILNGIPKKDSSIDFENNTKVNLNPNSTQRVKYVAKAFLTSEESKNVFSSLIKSVKKKQAKNLLGKLNIKLFEEEVEDDIKDDEEEEIEDIAESKKQKGPVDKIFELKKRFEKLKAIGQKASKVKTQISLMKAFFLALSMKSYSDAISSRNKILREMNSKFDYVKEKNIDPILNDAVIPSLTTTLFSMTGKTKNFIDDILSKYYNFLEIILGFIIEKEVVKLASLIPGLGGAIKIYDFIKSNYKKARRLYRKSRGIRAMEDIAEEIIENPAMVKEVMKGGVTGFFALFGHIDENGQRKIDMGIKQMIKASKNAGNNIIDNLSNSSSNNVTSTEDIGALFQTGKNVLNESKEIVDNKIDEMIDSFNEKTPSYKKYEFVYKIMKESYFKEIEYSPWTKAAMNLENMVLFVEKRFNNMFEKLNTIVESNMVFLNKSKNVLTDADLIKYFKQMSGSDGTRIIIKRGNESVSLKGRKKYLNDKDKNPLFVKAKTVATIRKDGESKTYKTNFKPVIRFYFSDELKEYYSRKHNKSKINFTSNYYERSKKNGQYMGKKIGGEEKTIFEVEMGKNLKYKRSSIKYKGRILECDNLKFDISGEFMKAINEKHYSPRGLILKRLFSPFTFSGIKSDYYKKQNNYRVKISKNDAKMLKDGTIAHSKENNDYNDENFTKYSKSYLTPVNSETIKNNEDFFKLGLIYKRDLSSFKEDVKLDVIMDKTELKWTDILSAEIIVEKFSINRFKNMVYNFQTIEQENENLKNKIRFVNFDLNGPYNEYF